MRVLISQRDDNSPAIRLPGVDPPLIDWSAAIETWLDMANDLRREFLRARGLKIEKEEGNG